jgi:transmembrane sensor
MTRRKDSGDFGEALGPLTRLAAARLPDPEDAQARRAQGFARIREALAYRRARRDRWRVPTWKWVVPVGTVMAVAAGAAVYQLAQPSLSYTVEGGMLAEGGYVHAPFEREAEVHFSDGTDVRLDRASRGRVASTSAHGARVMLDHGHARVKVVPRRGNRWVFDAGPCAVHVTGTRFDMNWTEVGQVLEVKLYSGSVTVEGPPAPHGLVMKEGQRLVMDVRHNYARLEALPPDLPPTVAPELPEPPAEEPAVEPERPRREHRSEARPETWSARVLAGDFDTVLREARRRGIDDVLRRDAAPDVMALAQAARLSRHAAIARKALTTLRSRFPTSTQAQTAAFLLGRMAEDHDGDLGRALEWYGQYLTEAPSGAFRDEALGRKMAATVRLSGAERARPVAEDYLRQFPSGAYAKPARTIVRAP